MATYLQGVTDTGFNSINTTPNLPYLMNALQKVTARYEKNYNDLSNQYSKITDSLLLNPENNEFRTKFLNNSKTALKTLSTTDLSVQSNIDQADQIFAPFWEDQDLLADYSKSKLYQQQVERHNALRSSDKKEDREQAWDLGLAYVQLTTKEMALAKRGDGSIQNVEVRPYVPYKNVSDELTKELKSLGFKDGTITNTYVGNGYITTITNGPGTKKIYANVLSNIIDGRSDLQEIFKVQGVTNFETSVFDILKENPSLSREEAEYKVKENYAIKSIKSFEKNINTYNEELNGNNEYKGLINEIAEIGPGIREKINKGLLTPDSPEAVAYFDKVDRKEELINVKNLYEAKINSLKSNDYYASKGEDYFTEIFKNQFIEDNAANREAAINKTTTSDASFVAARRIDSQEEMFNSRMTALENKINATNAGSSGNVTYDDKGNIIVGAKDTKVKPKELSESELLNIPTVGGINSKAKDLETSGYFNFQNFQANNKEAITSGASTYLNKSSLRDLPYMNKYIDFLTANATGSKNMSIFKKSEIEKAHAALVEKGILPANSKYTEYAFTQLNKLISYVDENNKNNIDLEGVTARGNYERASVYYLEADKIDKEFIAQYKKEIPNQSVIKFTEKNKNNEYQFITPQTLLTQYKKGLNAFNKIYGINTNPKDIPPVSLIQKYINGEITVQGGPAESYGGYPAPGKPYSIVDPNTGQPYNAEPIVRNYGKPEDFVAKRKEYEENKNRSFSKFATSNDWVMSRELIYRNNPSDAVQDRAISIANEAIDINKNNLIEKSGGIIKPVNYDELLKTADSDEIKEVLSLLFSNRTLLDNSLAATSLTFQGRDNESSNVKLEFDPLKLSATLKSLKDSKDAPSAKALEQAYVSILNNGIEFKIKKDTFKNYAKDNYMSSIVTERLLQGDGLTATAYEKNNLFYDYKITSGANDKITLKYKIRSYNPILKRIEEFEEVEWQYQEYSKKIGIDNILSDLRNVGLKSAYEINQYLKNQNELEKQAANAAEVKKQEAVKSNSQLYKQLPGESDADYEIRINKLRKNKGQ